MYSLYNIHGITTHFGEHKAVPRGRSVITIVACICLLLITGIATARDVTTLNFRGTDINAVISSVADITGKNFIVDPRVKGKVTIISTKPMSQGEIYEVFLSVLDVHGFTAVPSGEVIKIVPDADAKHSGMPTVEDGEKVPGEEAVTRVIQIEHVTAAQLVPILRPLVPPQGHLAAYPQSNVLIISDRMHNIDRLVNIIKRIDQPSSGEIEIVPLQYASAADLVRVLTALRQQNRKAGQQNAAQLTLVADERTNSILIGGERAERIQMRAIISHLDTPAEVEGDTHVIYLRYAKAKDLVPVLTGVAEADSKKDVARKGGTPVAARKTIPGGSSSILNIQADESSNALVISAPYSVYKSLEAVVRQLDMRRAQVLIEAVIAEVSSQKEAELGVQWILDGSSSDKPIGVVNFSGTSGSSISGLAGAAAAGGTSAAAGAASALGNGLTLALGRFTSDTFNFASLIKALEGDGETNVLSTPSLVTMDNQEAEIFVGNEVSIPTGSFTSTGTGSTPSNPFTTFDRVPVGISLKVKPQINEGDAIRLDIEQSVDNVTAGSAGTGDLVTSSRKINTNVMVDDGKVLVLGGLIRDDQVDTQQKVPLLGDIPILGQLFRYQSVKKVKTNLMVFLRPVIMRDPSRGLTLTNSKYSYIRNLQKQMSKRGVPLMSDEKTPMLPKIESFMELPPPFDDAAKKHMKDLNVPQTLPPRSSPGDAPAAPGQAPSTNQEPPAPVIKPLTPGAPSTMTDPQSPAMSLETPPSADDI
jgi:general secretion pathway protein D